MMNVKPNFCVAASALFAATAFLPLACVTVDDGYVKRSGNRWTFGTRSVERTVALEDGKLLLKSFKNKLTGRELVSGTPSSEFFFYLGKDKQLVTGATGPWKLIRAEQTRLKQGEWQLDLTVQRESLLVTKSYVVYPESSVIRQWLTIKNAGDQPLVIAEPGFLAETVRTGEPEKVDFNWMTGGDNQPNSWMLVTEPFPVKPRTFDSYDPFFGTSFPSDGINVKITLNDKQVWPITGWQCIPSTSTVVAVDLPLNLAGGDRLGFAVNMNRNAIRDTAVFDPTIRYDDGETHTASREFGDKQGQGGWRYYYITGDNTCRDMVYCGGPKRWRRTGDSWVKTPFIGAEDQQPEANQDVARVWTAPKEGRVRITATVRNTGSQSGESAGYGFRQGTATYAPWYALLANDTHEGVFVGWDYFGHWASSFQKTTDGSVAFELKVAGHRQALAPGESVVTPKAFVGLFRDDLDEAGNEVLDWQYRYLWDYTRDGWFPAIRALGWWSKGSCWENPGCPWTGGNADLGSTFRKVFRVADLMRSIGADVYHRDHGWWDRAGDWNGPDFRTTGDYLRKSDMGQLLYAFLYTVDPKSKVAQEHPDWLIGNTLDLSKPEVVEFMKGQLDDFYARWGAFEWRNDGWFTAQRKGDDTSLLGQDAGIRKVIREFLDKHPDCAFQGVNGGGNDAGYDYARLSSSVSFSDGNVGILRNYYASLLFPPDKTSDIPDKWNPNNYDKALWRGLLCLNFDMTGDTWAPEKLEGVRELIDIYHYLHREGVVGRWVKVYRPTVTGDDPTIYFQRLSGDQKRGIIIPKRPAPDALTIKPKGLIPEEKYVVSFHESEATETRSGADLMEKGIVLAKMQPGELIYLNLPMHPGSKLDKKPPTAPGSASRRHAENMGYPGVELKWESGNDNNWISYYEVLRNGEVLDKVAKGTYHFDHSAGADLAADYEIRTVDGAGNVSPLVKVAGAITTPARIFDDTAKELVCTGGWKRETGIVPAYEGTLSWSRQKGDSVELSVEGKTVLWFSKLGPDCGKASVSLDGAAPETVDTYSADDIFGVRVYRRALSPGKHVLRITVLGEDARHPKNSAKAKGTRVYIDGFRVEQ